MGRRRDRLSLLVMLALLALTLWVALRDWTLGELLAALGRAKPGWLLLGGGLTGGFVAFEALGSFLTLRALGRDLPYRRCLCSSAAGFYFSSITPSSTGGQPAQVFYLDRMGVPAAYGALDMMLLTVCYQVVSVAYALLAWAVAPWVPASLGTGLGVLLGYGATTMTVLTGLLLLLLFHPGPARRVCRLLLSLGARLRLVPDRAAGERALERQLEEYRRGAALLRGKPWLFPLLLATTACQFTCLYLIPWAVYRALGLGGLGMVQFLSTQALLALAVGALPIPGTVGAAEAAFLTAYRGAFGPALTPLAMLLSRGLSFYLPLLITGAATAALHWRTRLVGRASAGKTS